MKKTFTDHAIQKINNIHKLSKSYNSGKASHSEKLLKFIKEHDHEIHDLFKAGDDHFSVEVGDMMILCMELLLEEERDLDGIMDICYERFEKKLKGLIASNNGRPDAEGKNN